MINRRGFVKIMGIVAGIVALSAMVHIDVLPMTSDIGANEYQVTTGIPGCWPLPFVVPCIDTYLPIIEEN